MYVDDIKLIDKKQNINPTWKTLMKELIWESQHHSSTMFIWVEPQENVKSARILWIITQICWNLRFLPGLQKNCQKQEATGKPDAETKLHGPMTGKVMHGNAGKEIANFPIKTT